MLPKLRLLRYPGDLVPMPESRKKWLFYKILEGNFWDGESVTAASLFELIIDDDEEEEATPLSHSMY